MPFSPLPALQSERSAVVNDATDNVVDQKPMRAVLIDFEDDFAGLDCNLLCHLLSDPKFKHKDLSKNTLYVIDWLDPASKCVCECYIYLSNSLVWRSAVAGDGYYEVLGRNVALNEIWSEFSAVKRSKAKKVVSIREVIANIRLDDSNTRVILDEVNYVIVDTKDINPNHIDQCEIKNELLYFITYHCMREDGRSYLTAKSVNKIVLTQLPCDKKVIIYLALTNPILLCTLSDVVLDKSHFLCSPEAYQFLVLDAEVNLNSARSREGLSIMQLYPNSSNRLRVQVKDKIVYLDPIKNNQSESINAYEYQLRNLIDGENITAIPLQSKMIYVGDNYSSNQLRRLLDSQRIESSDDTIVINNKINSRLNYLEKISLTVLGLMKNKVLGCHLDIDNMVLLDDNRIALIDYSGAAVSDGGESFSYGEILGRLIQGEISNKDKNDIICQHLSEVHKEKITRCIEMLMADENTNIFDIHDTIDILRHIQFERKTPSDKDDVLSYYENAFNFGNSLFWGLGINGMSVIVEDPDDDFDSLRCEVVRAVVGIINYYADINLLGVIYSKHRQSLSIDSIRYIQTMYYKVNDIIHSLLSVEASVKYLLNEEYVNNLVNLPKLKNADIADTVKNLNNVIMHIKRLFITISDKDEDLKCDLMNAIGIDDVDETDQAISFNFIKYFIDNKMEDKFALFYEIIHILNALNEFERVANTESNDVSDDVMHHFQLIYKCMHNSHYIVQQLLTLKNSFYLHKSIFDNLIDAHVEKFDKILFKEFVHLTGLKSFASIESIDDVLPRVDQLFLSYRNLRCSYQANKLLLEEKKANFESIEPLLLDDLFKIKIRKKIASLESLISNQLRQFDKVCLNLDSINEFVNQAYQSWCLSQNDFTKLILTIDLLSQENSNIYHYDPIENAQQVLTLMTLFVSDANANANANANINLIDRGKVFITRLANDPQLFSAFSFSRPLFLTTINGELRCFVVNKEVNVSGLIDQSLCFEVDKSIVKAYQVDGQLVVGLDNVANFEINEQILLTVGRLDPTNLNSWQNQFLAQILATDAGCEEGLFYSKGANAKVITINSTQILVHFDLVYGLQWRLHDREHDFPYCYEILGQPLNAGSGMLEGFYSAGLLDPNTNGMLNFSPSDRVVKYYQYAASQSKRRRALLKEDFDERYMLAKTIPFLSVKPLVFMKSLERCAWIERKINGKLIASIINDDYLQFHLDGYSWLLMARAMLLSNVEYADLAIVNNDFKPSNVIYDTVSAKAFPFDVDLAQCVGSSIEGFVGSPMYAAPEQFVANANLLPFSDTYSIGIMLKIALGAFPIQQLDVNKFFQFLCHAIDIYRSSVNLRRTNAVVRIEGTINKLVATNHFFSSGSNRHFPHILKLALSEFRRISWADANKFIHDELALVLATIHQHQLSTQDKHLFLLVDTCVSGYITVGRNETYNELMRLKEQSHAQSEMIKCMDALIALVSQNAECIQEEKAKASYYHIYDIVNGHNSSVGRDATEMAAHQSYSDCFIRQDLDLSQAESALLLKVLNQLTSSQLPNQNDCRHSSINVRLDCLNALNVIDKILHLTRKRRLVGLGQEIQDDFASAYKIAKNVYDYFFELRTKKIGMIHAVMFSTDASNSFGAILQSLNEIKNHPDIIAEVVAVLDIGLLRNQTWENPQQLIDCLLRQVQEYARLTKELNALLADTTDKLVVKIGLDHVHRWHPIIHMIQTCLNRTIDEKSLFSFDNLAALNAKLAKHIPKIKAKIAQLSLQLSVLSRNGSAVTLSAGAGTFLSIMKRQGEKPSSSASNAKNMNGKMIKRPKQNTSGEIESTNDQYPPRFMSIGHRSC